MSSDIQLIGKTLNSAGYTYIIPAGNDIKKAYNSKDKNKTPVKIFSIYNIYIYYHDKILKKFYLNCKERAFNNKKNYLFMFGHKNKLWLMKYTKKGQQDKKIFSLKDKIIYDVITDYIYKCNEPNLKSPKGPMNKDDFVINIFKRELLRLNVYSKREIAYKRVSRNIFNNEPNRKINTADLYKIYKIYDDVYFDGLLNKYIRDKGYLFKLEVCGKTTEISAGVCSRSHQGYLTLYKLTMSDYIFNDVIFKSDDDRRKSNGIVCNDRLDCFLLTFEHELVHLIIYIFFKYIRTGRSSDHDELFARIVKNLFGQTDIYHDLFRKIAKYTYVDPLHIKVGDTVVFSSLKRGYAKGKVMVKLKNRNILKVKVYKTTMNISSVHVDGLRKKQINGSKVDIDWYKQLKLKDVTNYKYSILSHFTKGECVLFKFYKKDIIGKIMKIPNVYNISIQGNDGYKYIIPYTKIKTKLYTC